MKLNKVNVQLVNTWTLQSTNAQSVLIPTAWIALMPGTVTNAMMDSAQSSILTTNRFVNSKLNHPLVILAFTSMPTPMIANYVLKAATTVSQLITAMNAIKDGSVNKVKI